MSFSWRGMPGVGTEWLVSDRSSGGAGRLLDRRGQKPGDAANGVSVSRHDVEHNSGFLLYAPGGTRIGFTVGMCFGLAGAGLSVCALFSINFPLLVFGALLLGVNNAFWQYYRFAATDTASEEYRSRAISYVLAGGVVATFVGPELAKVSIDLFEPVKFAGGYAAVMGIILMSMCVIQFTQIPRPTAEERSRSGRPLL